jgi:outer membrane protein OmpA-like peptidoglycan-associated protein
LTTIAVSWKRSTIETDLLQRTRQALTQANLPSKNLSISGRDIMLNGTANDQSEAEHIMHVASEVNGVRNVENNLTIDPNTPVETTTETDTTPVAKLKSPATMVDGVYQPSKAQRIEKLDLSNIQFEYAKSDLNPEAKASLDKVAPLLRVDPKLIIEISAHTEAHGSALGSMAVSQARADAMRTYLIAKGVLPEQVIANGYGATRPIVKPASDLKNRRAEIVVLSKEEN